jgi:hypothetical protein
MFLPEKTRSSDSAGPTRRVGDWLLIPAQPPGVHDWMIQADEPIGQGPGGLVAQEAYRWGQETLYVSARYPLGVDEATYRRLAGQDASDPASEKWHKSSRSLGLYVRGRLQGNDGQECILDRWHRVRPVPVSGPTSSPI